MQYDVLIDNINPCGGEKHAIRTFQEAETDDPVEWVRKSAKFPVIDTSRNPRGDIIVVSANGRGISTAIRLPDKLHAKSRTSQLRGPAF